MSTAKTIDITTKKWHDKMYGNTYFSQQIVTDYGTENAKYYYNPFQYGYSSFEYEALSLLKKLGLVDSTNSYELNKNDGIIVRHNESYDLKKYVKLWGQE